MIITIIGSMKFYSKFVELKRALEDLGHKAIAPLPNKYYLNRGNIKLKAMRDFNKNLKKSDAILVANYKKNSRRNYIGINSIMEIGMAFNHGKKILILNNIPDNMKDELRAINVKILKGNLSKI